MKRTFTSLEKDLIFDSWKQGVGFSDIAKSLNSKPGTIFTVLRNHGGLKPHKRIRSSSYLCLTTSKRQHPVNYV